MRRALSRKITPADLPAPFATPSARETARIVARAGRRSLVGAAGFCRLPLRRPSRRPARDPRRAERRRVRRREPRRTASSCCAATGTGRTAHDSSPSGLDSPFGIAFYPPGPDPKYVYVGNTQSVVRFPYRSGDLARERAGRKRWSRRSAGQRLGPLDPRHRLFARRQADVRVGRLELERRREHAEMERPSRSARGRPQHGLGAALGHEANRADVLVFDREGGQAADLCDRHPQLRRPRGRPGERRRRGARSTSATGSATICRPIT